MVHGENLDSVTLFYILTSLIAAWLVDFCKEMGGKPKLPDSREIIPFQAEIMMWNQEMRFGQNAKLIKMRNLNQLSIKNPLYI